MGGGLVRETGGLYPKSSCLSPAPKTGGDGGGGGAQYSTFLILIQGAPSLPFFLFFKLERCRF